MNDDTIFEAEDATIDLEQVTALEEIGAEGRGLRVLLRDGSTVPVRGEDEAREFVRALDGHLEPDGER